MTARICPIGLSLNQTTWHKKKHGIKTKLTQNQSSEIPSWIPSTFCFVSPPVSKTCNHKHGTCQLCSTSHLMILPASSSADLAKGYMPHTPPETLQVSATHICTSAPSQGGVLLTLCCSCITSYPIRGDCTAPTASPDQPWTSSKIRESSIDVEVWGMASNKGE